MQTVDIVCSAPAGIDTTLVQVVAALSGSASSWTFQTTSTATATTTGNDNKNDNVVAWPSLQQTVRHAFSGQCVTTTAVGLTGIVRHVLLHALHYQGLSAEQRAAVESWCQSVEQTVLPIVRKQQGECVRASACVHEC